RNCIYVTSCSHSASQKARAEKGVGSLFSSVFPRPAARPQRRFQTQPLRHTLDPNLTAKRLSALRALPQVPQLRFALLPVHPLNPSARSLHRPIAQERREFHLLLFASP